jgi:hypothetical protein
VVSALFLNTYFLQYVFGILMLHLSSFGSFVGYTLISTEILIDDTDGESLVAGEHI